MAKEKIDRDGEVKGVGVLVIVLIIITWLSVMALLIKCDVGGFGSEVLRPVLKDVPVIKHILPDASDSEVIKESDYPYDNLSDALEQIAVLDAAVGSKDAQIVKLNDTIAELEAEVARLKVYETEKSELEQKKSEFYDEIVYGEAAPDADIYIEWYEQLDAENAERIYREMVEARQADKEILELASAYESMKPNEAAGILEKMGNDLDTVALIMNNMSTEARGKILAAMTPEFAASVTKKLLP